MIAIKIEEYSRLTLVAFGMAVWCIFFALHCRCHLENYDLGAFERICSGKLCFLTALGRMWLLPSFSTVALSLHFHITIVTPNKHLLECNLVVSVTL